MRAKGAKPQSPVPDIRLHVSYGVWKTIEAPDVRAGSEAWGTQRQTWLCQCKRCGDQRFFSARNLAKVPSCVECSKQERAKKKKQRAREEQLEREAKRAQKRAERQYKERLKQQQRKQLRLEREAEQKRLRDHNVLKPLWRGMIYRCKHHSNYAGRGISVCELWMNSYDAFKKYCDECLGAKPESSSIDRIDNNGNYEPGNIRWATQKQQMRNTRRSLVLTIDETTKDFMNWVDTYGLDETSATRARSRIANGWSPKEAFEYPSNLKRVWTKEVEKVIKENGLTVNGAKARLSRGWPFEDAISLPKGTVRMKTVKCHYCGQEGHLASTHPEYEKWLQGF